MREHLSHSEKMEQLQALRQRYSSREIGLKELQGALDGLGLSATEKQELLREVTDANVDAGRHPDDRDRKHVHDYRSGLAASPVDRQTYEKSLDWLATYKGTKKQRNR